MPFARRSIHDKPHPVRGYRVKGQIGIPSLGASRPTALKRRSETPSRIAAVDWADERLSFLQAHAEARFAMSWEKKHMAHLRPLEDEEIDDDFIKERFAHYANTRGFTPNSIRTMARRPKIVKAFMTLNQAILYEGSVTEELKMLVSLMCSYSAGCLYCQSHMANLSHIYSASDEKIAAIMSYEDSPLFSPAERAALDLAHKAAQIPNAATQKEFDVLAQYFDEGQIVEIVASIALFGYLNRWNDTMATTLEPLPSERANRILGKRGWTPGKHGAVGKAVDPGNGTFN